MEAGVKGLMDLAEGYIAPHPAPSAEGQLHTDQAGDGALDQRPDVRPIPIQATENPSPMTTSTPSSSATSSQLSVRGQEAIIQTTDVPSGWIHLQSTYLDGSGGQRKVRSFGLKNLVDEVVNVEVGSDLGGQLVFWQGEDDKRK